MVSFLGPPRPWPNPLMPGVLVSLGLAKPPGVWSTEFASGSRWSKFPAKSFNPLGNTSLGLSPQCKHMIFAYICLKTPLEFQTPSCCNGIQNWRSVCLVARVNSHTCWCIEIALCNHSYLHYLHSIAAIACHCIQFPKDLAQVLW